MDEGQRGICKARRCENGKIVCDNYGKLTSVALDPIEKKPLQRFFPGSMILSVGSYGCNLHCPFCQNSEISMSDAEPTVYVSPDTLIEKAKSLVKQGNIGIAYTYNEPLISYEYVLDCARLAHEANLKNVLVTNGTICEEPLRILLPYIDAMNIDLKGFTQKYYNKLGGDLDTVKRTIELSVAACHVEVTTLVVPRENDNEEEISAMAQWLASLSEDIPYHLSRFFPRYRMCDRGPTRVSDVYDLAEVARRWLKYVYTGNC
jgi:pyruvate formate lyase activating enzyme